MIRAGDNGPVKIGTSNQPFERLIALQTAHYEKLRIIRLFEGGEAEEAALHVRFADQHLNGEWHHFSRAMLGDLSLTEIPLSERPPTAIDGAALSAGEIVRLLGGATALSRNSALAARSAISNWPREGIPARFWLPLARIAAVAPETQHITLAVIERHTVSDFFAEPTP
jgi:hypothetical protein